MVMPTLEKVRSARTDPWSPTLSIYIVIVVSMAIWTVSTRLQINIGGDDALRLVQIRDLLAGQSWFDLTQHRLGSAGGTEVPLFRLVDAPIAGLILLLDLFLDRAGAEALAMTLWPGLLFGLVVACLYVVCYRLGGPKAAVYGATLASISVVQTGKFDPGSLNHGNVQMALLMLAVVGFVMRRQTRLAAGVGGASVALSLAIGPEVAAQIAVVCAAHAAVWAWRGHAEKTSTMTFALAAMITSGLVIAISPSLHPVCGGGSVTNAFGALAASAGLVGLAGMASTVGQNARFAGIIALSVAVFALVWFYGAPCFSDARTALDVIVRETWLDHVMDTESIAGFEPDGSGALIGCGVGWLISVWFVRTDVRRDPWTLLCLLLGVTLVMTAFRGHTSAVLSMMTILPTSIFAARMIERGNSDAGIWKNVVPIAVLLMSIPAITGAATAMNAAAKEAREVSSGHGIAHTFAKKGDCTPDAEYAVLAGLGEGVVLAPLKLVPRILLHTPHRVVPELVHRALADDLPHPKAAAHFREAGIAYVVHCRRGKHSSRDDAAFAAQVQDGVEANVLTRVRSKKSRSLLVYRVLEP